MTKQEMELKYITFILGYDLLNDYFKNQKDSECDTVFEQCILIANEFYNDSEYNNPNKSLYDCLQEYVNDKYLGGVAK